MTKTKIKYSTVLMVIGLPIIGVGVSIWILYARGQDLNVFMKLFAFPLVAIASLLTTKIEFPKLKSVEIRENKLLLMNLLTGQKREILYSTIDGFKTITQMSRYGLICEIILFKNCKRFHDISSNYVQNYDPIRVALGKRLSNLGTEKFSYFKYLKERLTI